MKVEIIVDPTKAPPAPLTSRIAPAAVAPAPMAPAMSAPNGNGPRQYIPQGNIGGISGQYRRGGPARGRGRGGPRGSFRGGGGGGRGGRDSRPAVSKEDLDQEMEDWVGASGEVEEGAGAQPAA